MISTHWVARATLLTGLLVACGLEERGKAPLEFEGGSGGVGIGGDGAIGGSSTVGGSGGTGGEPTGGSAGASGGAGAPGTCAAIEQCVPKAPSGWSYAWMADGPYVSNAPPGELCPDGGSPKRWFSEPAGSGSCTPCTCGPLTGGCSVGVLCAANKTCSSATPLTVNDGDCHGQGDTSQWSCALGAPTFTPVSCTPAGGVVVPQEPWKKIADVCDAKPSTSCGADQQCVPRGSGSYAGFICVYQPGDQTCPADYTIRTLVYLKSTDDRKCATCACAAGTPSCVGANYTFYDDYFCIGSGKAVTTTGCSDLSSYTSPSFISGWAYRKKSSGSISGSCTASGGEATGALSGDQNSALTVCCRYPST